jgi:hypothetical protein
MTESITDRIRSACRAVSERAKWVRIDAERICEYTQELPVDDAVRPTHDAACHFLDHGEETLAFFLTLDSINFNSGYNPHLKKRPGLSGYFTIACALKDCFVANGPLSAGELMHLTVTDCNRIFDQDPANPVAAELMHHFTLALNDLGLLLTEKYSGRFTDLVLSAGNSAEKLMQLLMQMSYYQDIETYKGIEVPFLKRAQIAAADLHLAFAGDGWGRFDDIDRLTIFADNLVPHVLRVDGVLHFDSGLADRIDAGQLIPLGSEEEIEIRACGLHAVELLKAEFINQGSQLTSRGLDYLLWNRGRLPRYKAVPRHRTRSVYY